MIVSYILKMIQRKQTKQMAIKIFIKMVDSHGVVSFAKSIVLLVKVKDFFLVLFWTIFFITLSAFLRELGSLC